jgi:hypothetical protein
MRVVPAFLIYEGGIRQATKPARLKDITIITPNGARVNSGKNGIRTIKTNT